MLCRRRVSLLQLEVRHVGGKELQGFACDAEPLHIWVVLKCYRWVKVIAIIIRGVKDEGLE